MRSSSPSLLPILRSQAQAEILASLYLHPERELSLTDLSQTLTIPLTTVHDEVKRLERAELLNSRPIGRVRLLRANQRHPAAKPLTELLTISFGPLAIVSEEFSKLDADQVLIFGSWAHRYRGVEGPPPNDVDVLVIGDTARSAIYDAADRAQTRLSLEVNPVKRTARQWDEESDALVRDVRASPYVLVSGGNDEVEARSSGD